MRSPTQRVLDPGVLEAMVAPVLGASVVGAAELSGGGFAAVWQATLTDGREIVGKSPASHRCRGCCISGEGWLATTLLPGRSLAGQPGSAAVREQLGRTIARVHDRTGDHFGYTGDRPSGPDWPTAFTAAVDALLADAADWDVPLPAGIRAAVDRHRTLLATVRRPALLHFDLWDGNVLAEDGRRTGLVDGERFRYGDPLLDLVSPALFRRIEDEPDHPFLRGYAAATGLVLDDPARVRLALYRLHLCLLMLAEGPSRGIPAGGERHEYLTGLLTDELTHLRGS